MNVFILAAGTISYMLYVIVDVQNRLNLIGWLFNQKNMYYSCAMLALTDIQKIYLKIFLIKMLYYL